LATNVVKCIGNGGASKEELNIRELPMVRIITKKKETIPQILKFRKRPIFTSPACTFLFWKKMLSRGAIGCLNCT
jgi:hypothetical protein